MHLPSRILFSLALLATTATAAEAPAAHPENALADGPPLVDQWSPPVYPADALQEKVGGYAMVRIIVDPTGHVSAARALTASDPRLGEAALAAVKKWVFHPAISDAKPVAACIDVPQFFDAAKGDQSWKPGIMPDSSVLTGIRAAPRTPATLKSGPFGNPPAELGDRKVSGTVSFSCDVDATGHGLAIRVLRSTHADFVQPTVARFSTWEFKPALQGDLPIASEMGGEAAFGDPTISRVDVLAANGVTNPDGSAVTLAPGLLRIADPIFPIELLLKGEGGAATVEFTVQTDGGVGDVKVRDATKPEFGRALAAATETWIFQPALVDGKAAVVPLVRHVDFRAMPVGPVHDDDPVERVVALARAGSIRGGSGLDEKITPIYRVSPRYPVALRANGRPAGQAVVEIVIDRTGRARLPRLISATNDDFGWAAATAAAQWVFKAPLRGGQPTDVRVQVPFQFSAPTD